MTWRRTRYVVWKREFAGQRIVVKKMSVDVCVIGMTMIWNEAQVGLGTWANDDMVRFESGMSEQIMLKGR